MFQVGRDLENFPRVQRKYNYSKKIMKFVEMADDKYGGR